MHFNTVTSSACMWVKLMSIQSKHTVHKEMYEQTKTNIHLCASNFITLQPFLQSIERGHMKYRSMFKPYNSIVKPSKNSCKE